MPDGIETAKTMPAETGRESLSPSLLSLRSDGNGGIMARHPARWWFLFLIIALGGGSGGNVLARYFGFDKQVIKLSTAQEETDNEVDALKVWASGKFETTNTRFNAINTALVKIDKRQRWWISDEMARRVAASAPRATREDVRMSLFRQNMARMEAGGDPCMDIRCSN